jgi:hypothetical protein
VYQCCEILSSHGDEYCLDVTTCRMIDLYQRYGGVYSTHLKRYFKSARHIINLLKPSGNFTYTRFNIKKFYVVPTLCLCVLYGSQNKQQLLPYKTVRDWFL